MSHHVRPAQYDWGYNWSDDCPPPYYGRVTFAHVPPAHARVALQLPPCQPRAGVNTDWSGSKCAVLHYTSSYALLLPSPPTQPPASPSAARTQTLALHPPEPQASPSAPSTQTPVLQPPQPQALQPAPPAQPTPPKPAAEPVTVGQAAHDHVHPEPTMANLGFDVAVALCLALAFVVVRRFILDLIEPPGPSPEQADEVEHETRRRQLRERSDQEAGNSDGLFV
jgi:hypothetical protein